jgi:hypothetical protein
MEFAQILFGQLFPSTAFSWRTPKVTCHATGQVLTIIVDHRQRSPGHAFMSSRPSEKEPPCGFHRRLGPTSYRADNGEDVPQALRMPDSKVR